MNAETDLPVGGDVFDAFQRAIIVTTPDGTVLVWNSLAAELFGWTPDDAIGRSVLDVLVPPETRHEAEAILAGPASGSTWEGEFVVNRADGEPALLLVSLRPIRDTAGQVVAVLGESSDLTAQRRLENELRVSRDRLALAVEAGRLGTWQWDRDTGLTAWDTALEEVFGLAAGSFDGTFEAWIGLVHPDDRAEVLGTLERAVAERSTYRVEHRVLTSDGTTRWVEGLGRVLVDANGEAIGSVGCAHDVTVRKLAESRLGALQAVAAGLSQARTADEVAEVIVRQGSAALGGHTGSLCLLDDSGETFELVKEVGYRPQIAEDFRYFPAAAPLPAGDALRRRELIFLSSIAERDEQYPALAGINATDNAFAILPLLLENGRGVGVFTIGFQEERQIGPDECQFLEALASLCAQAIDRARLFESTQTALAAAERANARLAFLDEASEVLGETFDYRKAIAALARLVVPRLADACAVLVVEEDGDGRPIAVVHRDPEKEATLRQFFEGQPPDQGSGRGFGAVLLSGEPRFFETTAATTDEGLARDDTQERVLDELGIHSVAIVPLRSRGRVIGALGIARHRDRPLTPAEFTLAQELAARSAVAIDNARAFAERSRVADRLQANLLPRSLPAIPGLDVAVRYSAAGEGIDVGGDFYDVFAAADGWVVTIGDVKGKGLEAAHVTAMARHTIRAIAPLSDSPAAILHRLNDRLRNADPSPDDDHDLDEPQFCTVALARVDATADGRFTMRLASGGHPLPLLCRAGVVREVGTPGAVLGIVADPPLTDVTVELEYGDAMVFFTDGITERHDGDRFFDESGVAEVLATVADRDAGEIAAAVEAAARGFVEKRPHDDMAVVALRCC